MRRVRRNLSKFYYATYLGMKRMEKGGESEPNYSEPQEAWATITAAKGDVRVQPFGAFTDYERLLTSVEVPIVEDMILWIDNLDTSKPHDYTVKRVAEWKNSRAVAAKKKAGA